MSDSASAGTNDPPTVTSITQPANGSATVAANGNFSYTPATTFSGIGSFTYSISDGDAGHDRIFGGSGASLLFGGDGNDQLTGGSGRDILIGGQGADKLVGNSGDDVLIAGLTTKDNRAIAGVEEFWCKVMEEWNSTNSFADRLANLRSASSQTANALNGTSYLLPVVMDDTSADEIDMLQGSSGNDWFLYRAGEDKVAGQIEAVN